MIIYKSKTSSINFSRHLFIFAPDSIKHAFIISRYWSSSVWFISIKDVVTPNLMNCQNLTYLFYVRTIVI